MPHSIKKSSTPKHAKTDKSIDNVAPSQEPEPTRRVHLSYAGQVNTGQFVYTATENAERLGLTGWISRAYHGIADLVVQGPASKVNRYEKKMLDNDASGVLYNLADLEELKPIESEEEFARFDY